MNNPETTYSWEAAYLSAVLETDFAAMPLRIYEALTAIEERQLACFEIDSDEDRALKKAEQGLRALKAERLDTFEAH
jgi:hypothetical protein